jgi:hypothetical protein
MGAESAAEFVSGREKVAVKVHLDSQHLQLQGGRKLKLALSEISRAEARGDDLHIQAATSAFVLRLPVGQAAKWAAKILNPPSLATKLGLKPGRSVQLVGKLPPEVLEGAGSAKSSARMPARLTADIAIVALPPEGEAAVITAAATRLQKDSALWLVYRKGEAFNGDAVIAAARKAGLKDTKVARISDTHTGLRFIRAGGKG